MSAFAVRRVLLSVAVVLTAVLLGVVLSQGFGLRTPGGVRVDQRSDEVAADAPDIRELPPGPIPGAPPQDIVRGFLVAAAADPSHSLAQQFLVSSPSEARGPHGSVWSNRDAATVYAPESVAPLVARVKGQDALVRFRAEGMATLSSDGAFLPTASQLDASYQLHRVHDQWRLSYVPPGVLLTPRDLARGYRRVITYGYNAARRSLVPEPGYVASDSAGEAGAALHALLTGWGKAGLSGADPSPGPVEGLSALGSVVVRDGTAIVDLGREAFQVPQDRRPLVVAQIAATLGSVPGVSEVRVLVEERPYIGGLVSADIPAELANNPKGPALAIAPDGALLSVSGAGGRRVLWVGQGPGPGKSAPQPAGLAVPVAVADGTRFAGLVSAPGPALVVADLATRVAAGAAPGPSQLTAAVRVTIPLSAAAGASYLRPQWLDSQRVLLIQGGGPGRLSVADLSNGSIQAVASPGLATLGPLTGAALSRDGTRIVAIAGPPGARALYLGRITGAPRARLQVASWDRVRTQLGDVNAASWSADLGLVVLGRVNALSPVRVVRVALDSLTDPVALPALPGEVASAATSAALGVASSPGRMTQVSLGLRRWTLSDGWLAGSPAGDLAYP